MNESQKNQGIIMKFKLLFILITTAFSMDWIDISSENPVESSINLISSDIDNSQIQFTQNGFYFDDVDINGESYKNVKIYRPSEKESLDRLIERVSKLIT